MSWKYVDDLLLKFSKNSTLLGKYWVACVLILRLIVITVFAESVWSDEQREFTCNTKQPGCGNICFNKFTPISNVRLWGLQVLAVSLPGALYFTYVLHQVVHESGKKDSSSDKTNKKKTRNSSPKVENISKRKKSLRQMRHSVIPAELLQKRISSRRVWRLYILQILFRILLEGAFLALQLMLYDYRWRVPEVYRCTEWPCPHTVDCFISRPQEKTVLLIYMYVTTGLSIIVSTAELWYIIWACGRKTWERKYSIFPDKKQPPKITIDPGSSYCEEDFIPQKTYYIHNKHHEEHEIEDYYTTDDQEASSNHSNVTFSDAEKGGGGKRG